LNIANPHAIFKGEHLELATTNGRSKVVEKMKAPANQVDG
jgi:hypothetical protein